MAKQLWGGGQGRLGTLQRRLFTLGACRRAFFFFFPPTSFSHRPPSQGCTNQGLNPQPKDSGMGGYPLDYLGDNFFFFFLSFFWFSFTPHKWIHHQGLGYLFFLKSK